MVKINVKKYLEWLEKRNLPSQTIIKYNWGLKQYGTREFDTENIVEFFKQNLTKYKPNSLSSLRVILKSYASFEKIIIEWELTTRIIPSVQQKFFPTVDKNELEKLKRVQTRTKSATNQRNNLILDFLFWTGIRVKELINIRHCDYQGGSLKVHGKGNKIRYIFIPQFLIKYFNGSSDYLFKTWKNEKISKLQVQLMIIKKAKLAGLTKHVTPHTFRRSFATLANSQEIKLTAIQKFLGHSNLQTTANYIHNSREELYHEYSKLWKSPLNSTPPPTLI